MRSKKTNDSKNIRKIIMVIDFDHSIRSGLETFLSKDFDIVEIDNGPDAFHYIKEIRIPDLVVLDMEIPKLNGRVFVRRIKVEPMHNKIPIVLISSVNSQLIINSFLKLGIDDYLVKPYETSVLVEKILNIITHVN